MICTAAVCACVVVATRTTGWKRAVLLALAVGVLFGVVAMLTKLVMHAARSMKGCVRCSLTPVPYLLVVIGVVAMLLQQSAFHAGSLQTSVPTMLVLEPVIAVLLGAIVLGENLDVRHLDAVADHRRTRRDGRGHRRARPRRGCVRGAARGGCGAADSGRAASRNRLSRRCSDGHGRSNAHAMNTIDTTISARPTHQLASVPT